MEGIIQLGIELGYLITIYHALGRDIMGYENNLEINNNEA
jgi:hypothetical protein